MARKLATCFNFRATGVTSATWVDDGLGNPAAANTALLNRIFGPVVKLARSLNSAGGSAQALSLNLADGATGTNLANISTGSSQHIQLTLDRTQLSGAFGWSYILGIRSNLSGSGTLTPTDAFVVGRAVINGTTYTLRLRASGTNWTGVDIYNETTASVLASYSGTPVSAAYNGNGGAVKNYECRAWFSSTGIYFEFAGLAVSWNSSLTMTLGDDPVVTIGSTGTYSNAAVIILQQIHICDGSGTIANSLPAYLATTNARVTPSYTSGSGFDVLAATATAGANLVDASTSSVARANGSNNHLLYDLADNPARPAAATTTVAAVNFLAIFARRPGTTGNLRVDLESGADVIQGSITTLSDSAANFGFRNFTKADGTAMDLTYYNAAQVRVRST